jgi:hypothetical protein
MSTHVSIRQYTPGYAAYLVERAEGQRAAVERDTDVGAGASTQVVHPHRQTLQRVVVQPCLAALYQ